MEKLMIKILTMAIAALCAVAPARAADFKIMIATWKGCEEACTGFQDYLTERGHDVEFLLRDADQDATRFPGFIADARNERADLILTWGTSVTRAVAGTLDDVDDASFPHEIPLVFTVVADPVGARIVESLDATGRENVTGTYNRVPERVNIETIRAYFPGFRHLGLLWNRNETNSALKKTEITALSKDMGFEFTALETPLRDDGRPSMKDIEPGVAALKAAGVDFIYVGSSSFLDAHRDVFTAAAVANGLPVLSPYERFVRDSQALISIAAKYYDTGRLAGAVAERILVDGARPGDLPVARMTDFAFVINMNVAKKLGLFPPIDLLQIAEIVE